MNLSVMLLLLLNAFIKPDEFILIEGSYLPIIYGRPDSCPLIFSFMNEYLMIAYSYKLLEIAYFFPLKHSNLRVGISLVEIFHGGSRVLPVRCSFETAMDKIHLSLFSQFGVILIRDLLWDESQRRDFEVKYGIRTGIIGSLSLEIGKQLFYFSAYEEVKWVTYAAVVSQLNWRLK